MLQPTLQQRRLKTPERLEPWLPVSVGATQILCSGISKRIIVLISNVSEMKGPDSADLPKVTECRWSFVYLEKQTLFYQGRR